MSEADSSWRAEILQTLDDIQYRLDLLRLRIEYQQEHERLRLLFDENLEDIRAETSPVPQVHIPATRFWADGHSVHLDKDTPYIHPEEGVLLLDIPLSLTTCEVLVLTYLDQAGRGMVVWEYRIYQHNQAEPEAQVLVVDQEGREVAMVYSDLICTAPAGSRVAVRRADEHPQDTCPIKHIKVIAFRLLGEWEGGAP